MSEKKKILLVADRSRIAWRTVRFSARLAGIMGCDLVGLYVQPEGRRSRLGGLFGGRDNFAEKAHLNAAAITQQLAQQGIRFEYQTASGPISAAVDEYQRRVRRVGFVLQEVPSDTTATRLDVSVPVYSFERGRLPWMDAIMAWKSRPSGGRLQFLKHATARRRTMATSTRSGKASCVTKMAVALAGAGAMYGGLFANESLVTSYFTRGGLYAALPILTAFAFSFVYSAFASNFWTMLGIEAHQKTQQPRRSKTPTTRKDTRPRPTLAA